MPCLSAKEIIELLKLEPLPFEGGYFRETYRSSITLPPDALPRHYSSNRSVSTAIYYLLTDDTVSRLHRLPTEEIFHFYLGDPVSMLQLHPDGNGRLVVLGADLQAGHSPQLIVPAGTWIGMFLHDNGRYALMGTTMAPGFDIDDFEPGNRDQLIKEYPDYSELIRRLT